jgi:uncharacterized protein
MIGSTTRKVPLNGDPTMEAVDVRGRFVWHQLATRDVPGAKKFYSKLAGWNPQPWPLDHHYIVCHSDAGPVAGIMEIPREAPADFPAHWLGYVGTRDVDGTADAAVRAGGSIMKSPGDMKGAGRYAVLKDPQGAMFAILDPENARPPHDGVPPLGSFSWHELATTDIEAAFAFYSGLFGWDAITRMDMGPNGIYLIFGSNGVQRGGMYVKPAGWQAPPNWLPYAHVPSADDGFALALSTGAKEMLAPMNVPDGSRIASFVDPGGAVIAIHSVSAAAARPKKTQVLRKAKRVPVRKKVVRKKMAPKKKRPAPRKVKLKSRKKTKMVRKKK